MYRVAALDRPRSGRTVHKVAAELESALLGVLMMVELCYARCHLLVQCLQVAAQADDALASSVSAGAPAEVFEA